MTKRKEFVGKMVQAEILDEFKEIAKSIIEKLKEIIAKSKDKKPFRIAILTHDDPDPDAISSALALKRCFRKKEIENVEIFANEESISREVKAIKDKVCVDIQPLEKFNRKSYKAVILVDAESINQSNIKLKNGNQPDLIIDHHDDESPFGATATIVTLIMTVLNIEIDEDIATALTVGIKTDTDDLASKKVSKFDRLAYRKILAFLVDDQLLKEIEECGYSASFRIMLESAFKYRYQEGSTVISGVGYIKPNQRTNLAKVANFLLKEEGVEKVIVLAIVENEIKDGEGNVTEHEKFIIPAARASTPTEDIGDLNKRVFGEKAGGDSAKASGEVPLDDDLIKDIERAKKDENHIFLEGYFIDILNRYKEKILEEQTE